MERFQLVGQLVERLELVGQFLERQFVEWFQLVG